MSEQQDIALYLSLNDDIHAYWAGFGAVAVLLFGWMLSRNSPPSASQRIALTLGWLVATGYLASSLMGAYRMLNALAHDVAQMVAGNPGDDSFLLRAIREYAPIYEHYETLVWSSSGLITLCVLFVIWSNVLTPRPRGTGGDAGKKPQQAGENTGRRD